MNSASAKVILFGEHSVVYGQPAIAVPLLGLRAYAEIVEEQTPFRIVARDLNDRVITFDGDDPLAQVARLTLEAVGIPAPPIALAVRSDIPIASGLGSGAAISAAIIRALLAYLERELPQEMINQIVYDVEKIHHGTPSGIDNTVIVYEQAVYFVREQPIEMIDVEKSFRLIVADTGQTALTKYAVGDVRRLYEDETERTILLIEKIGAVVREARQMMQRGDISRLGVLMTENHHLLQALTVSSSELDQLVMAALDAGARGAKLSGGGRGGNMIALVDDQTYTPVITALKQAGAVRLFGTTVE
ncbi:MAG: mevalonate kinase [Anaerolineae bacterium]